jgi:hypothetical protein
MSLHQNSLAAYLSLDLGEREAAVLKTFCESPAPLTDREVMRRLGFTDPNAVRPRCTDLVERGLLEECGTTQDPQTGKSVRLCRPAGRALALKVPDPVKQQRKEVCQLIAKMEEQGASELDLARVFPSLGAKALHDAVGACWAHGYLTDMAGEIRQGARVWHITKSGLCALGLDPTDRFHADRQVNA